MDFSEAELAEVEEGRRTPVTAILVVAASDAESFLLARRVRRITAHARRWQAPLFVRRQRIEQYAGSLAPLATGKTLDDVIEPFGELWRLCSEAALRDWHAALPQRLTMVTLQTQRRRSGPDRDFLAKQGLHEISEEFREANRRADRYFPLKL